MNSSQDSTAAALPTDARVVIVGRNDDNGRKVSRELTQASGNEHVCHETADLSRAADIRSLAARLCDALPRIDRLVNNAGGYFAGYAKTDEGLEYTFALNHLSYALLTDLLLDRLKAADEARIVNVASGVHRGVSLDLDDPQFEAGYDGWLAYRRSKLMNVMYTYALARRLEGTGVTTNVLHPGFVRSRFGHNNPGLRGWGMRLGQRLAAISLEAGAATSLHVATDPALAGISGRYFERSRETASSPQSHDMAAQERLWQLTHNMLD